MINFIKNLVLIIMLAATGCAQASILTHEQLSKTLNDRIYNETKQQLSNISDDFQINITGIPNEDYQTSDTDLPKIEIVSQNSNFTTNSYRRVIIKDSKNNTVKAFPINVQTLVYKEILVAGSNIGYNQEVKADNLKIEKREISKYIGKTYSTYKEGLIASRNFQTGSIILSDYVKPKSVVAKNSLVEIIFVSDKGITITVQGKAMKDGAIGDTIPVRSNKYNRIYNAKISSSNEVIVRI